MKSKEKNLAIIGASMFLAFAVAIGTFIRKLSQKAPFEFRNGVVSLMQLV